MQAQADAIRARVDLATIFNPSGPVSHRDLLQGRVEERGRLLSAVSHHGQHAILFGERGVGKTSLASLTHELAPSTLILVGVADTVDDLIEDHSSIDRATLQVSLPRMSRPELRSIIENAYDRVGISTTPHLYDLMADLAQGLPHYAHRLGQEAGFASVERGSLVVNAQDVTYAVDMAIELSQESIRKAYRQATASPRKDALFGKVLLACALARGDDLGFFAPSDVRKPLEYVTGRTYDFPQFVRHLEQFTSHARGAVLQVAGERRRRRYRFANPLLRPYVVLRGIQDRIIATEALSEFDPESEESSDDGQARLL